MREYTEEEAEAIATKMRNKADRREQWATSAHNEAGRRYDTARQATAGIPLGQPILVGHYSAKRHRAAIKRSDTNMRKSVEAAERAKHHDDKAKRQRAWANEVERRAQGPRYNRADLQPGDRISTNNNTATTDAVIVRTNAKSVTAYAVYTAPHDTNELAPIWANCSDLNPARVPYLKIRTAWRQDGEQWTEVGAA